ncbi:MAG: PDZ domain-containing protein [Desulfosalsimonadaceae bacterium]|nr:PDZ domain-containing protein [Desulfosalsimonadaceae bacterium]
MKKKHIFILLSLLSVGCVLAAAAWFVVVGDREGQKTTDAMDAAPQARPDARTTSPENTLSSPDQTAPDGQLPSIADALKHLRLVGIAFNAKGEPSAVIADTTANTQGLYKQGDMVGGAVIIKIQHDAVVLGLNAETILLKLEKSASGKKPLSTEDLLQEPPPAFVHTTQADVEEAWDETQSLMTQIELEQRLVNGEPGGVSIQKVVQGSVFEKIGFKPGDILVKVDDMDMRIADDAMEVYNCIRTQSEASFTVIRKGEPDPVILEYIK